MSGEEDGLLQREDGLLQTRKTVCRLSFPVSHQPSVIPPASQHQQHVTDCLPPVQLWICGNQHHQSSAQGPQWCTRQPGSSSSCGTDCMPVRSGCVECCRAAQTPGHPQVPGCSVSASHLIHTSVTHPPDTAALTVTGSHHCGSSISIGSCVFISSGAASWTSQPRRCCGRHLHAWLRARADRHGCGKYFPA